MFILIHHKICSCNRNADTGEPVESTSAAVRPEAPSSSHSDEPVLSTSSAVQPTKSSKKRRRVYFADDVDDKPKKSAKLCEKADDVDNLVRSKHLEKEDRDKLYNAIERHFEASTVVTRSMLQAWCPAISEENCSYILMRRNTELANAMISNMKEGSRRRQEKILAEAVKRAKDMF